MMFCQFSARRVHGVHDTGESGLLLTELGDLKDHVGHETH